jgi:hypothetical protein
MGTRRRGGIAENADVISANSRRCSIMARRWKGCGLSASPQSYAHVVAAFRHGLKEAGYVEGQNIAIEYRWGRSFCDDVSYGGAGHLHLQGARKR